MANQLPKCATIISVYDDLTYPSKYCRSVLQRMRECVREHGKTAVRIGITGSGQKPCYRICYADEQGAEKVHGSWWDMGDPLSTEDAVTQNWSTESVSYKELEDFLASRLGYEGPRPKP